MRKVLFLTAFLLPFAVIHAQDMKGKWELHSVQLSMLDENEKEAQVSYQKEMFDSKTSGIFEKLLFSDDECTATANGELMTEVYEVDTNRLLLYFFQTGVPYGYVIQQQSPMLKLEHTFVANDKNHVPTVYKAICTYKKEDNK